MPVSRTINDDFPWSTCQAVATTRFSGRLSGRFSGRLCGRASGATSAQSSSSRSSPREGVPDRACEVGHLCVGDRPKVEQHVIPLHPAEHARTTGSQPGGEPVGIGRRHPHAPRRDAGAGVGAPTDRRFAPMHAAGRGPRRPSEPSSERAPTPPVCAACAPPGSHRRRPRRSWPRPVPEPRSASCRRGRRGRSDGGGVARSGPPFRRSYPPGGRRAACRRRRSRRRPLPRGRRRPPARPPAGRFLPQQPRPHVVQERHPAPSGERGELLGGGGRGSPRPGSWRGCTFSTAPTRSVNAER